MEEMNKGLYATKKTQKQKIISLFVIILVAGKDENVKLPPKEKREICSKKSGLKWCS
jgi:hypothetical protein